MTKDRKARLKEARTWYPAQNFTENSHIVKAYRKRFNVDKDCAMKELCLLGMLSAEKQKTFEAHIKRKNREAEVSVEQDENFAFIVGYTSGGAPYGLSWDEMEGEDQAEEPF